MLATYVDGWGESRNIELEEPLPLGARVIIRMPADKVRCFPLGAGRDHGKLGRVVGFCVPAYGFVPDMAKVKIDKDRCLYNSVPIAYLEEVTI